MKNNSTIIMQLYDNKALSFFNIVNQAVMMIVFKLYWVILCKIIIFMKSVYF